MYLDNLVFKIVFKGKLWFLKIVPWAEVNQFC